MSFPLPPAGSFAREAMGDVAYVAEVLDPRNIAKLRDYRQAVRETVANFPKGAKSVAVICLRADDERWLIQIRPRGGVRKLWNFGTGRPA
ncbi:MAG: hypothetical protein KGL39_41500 [Patescibacteria group bacterium]|nr:hypothetical protein [Patescibacteria group bacterium]